MISQLKKSIGLHVACIVHSGLVPLRSGILICLQVLIWSSQERLRYLRHLPVTFFGEQLLDWTAVSC